MLLAAAPTLALFIGAQAAGAQPTQAAKAMTPAAKVGNEVITLEEVEQAVRPRSSPRSRSSGTRCSTRS
jgi:hypothetical protein